MILGQSGPDSKSANYQLIWTGKRIQQNQNDSEQVYQWPLWTIKDLGILDSRKIGPTGGSAPGKKVRSFSRKWNDQDLPSEPSPLLLS